MKFTLISKFIDIRFKRVIRVESFIRLRIIFNPSLQLITIVYLPLGLV
jgi:hypothetical protein